MTGGEKSGDAEKSGDVEMCGSGKIGVGRGSERGCLEEQPDRQATEVIYYQSNPWDIHIQRFDITSITASRAAPTAAYGLALAVENPAFFFFLTHLPFLLRL